ncbi:OLC1v1034034C1 [Oldenlandia corymbosa var. corymbosa]|uniref:OLC1v1034034C1 n=1 Tax=Oldenlandia corymbosa var. corymbosa TaxID=529605 RepID=A0AAV1CSS4_OLDCO|nr:OLC1v1034034C1 [Oldenlandia corymbosa var. corymbosa]
MPAPKYKEVTVDQREMLSRRAVYIGKGICRKGCGFWLGLPVQFCKKYLPNGEETVTLVDEQGKKWDTTYLGRKAGLSAGWKRFAVDHDLVDGDALVFQLLNEVKEDASVFQSTKCTAFKVYIIRQNGFGKKMTRVLQIVFCGQIRLPNSRVLWHSQV